LYLLDFYKLEFLTFFNTFLAIISTVFVFIKTDMKRIFIILLGLAGFFFQVQAQSQKSGVIQFESTFDPAALTLANGIRLSEEATARIPKPSVTSFELLFNQAQASYKQAANPDLNKNRSGNSIRYGGLGVFGGGISKDYYYSFEDHKLTQAFELNDTLLLMEDKLGMPPVAGVSGSHPVPLIEYIQTDNAKEILGFNCHQVIVKITVRRKIQGIEREITDQVILWYTHELGFDFSPNPVLWTEGAVLAIEGKGARIEAKNIQYKEVNARDLDLPEKGIKISQQQLRAKIDLRVKQIRLSRIGSWN
jgi:GLPGLI family protein